MCLTLYCYSPFKNNEAKEELLRIKISNEKSRKETDRQMKETDRKLDKIGRLVGSISNNQGDVVEEFFYNSLSGKATVGNIHYDYTDKNITRKKGDIEDEFDIVLVNSSDVAIIETKYKAH